MSVEKSGPPMSPQTHPWLLISHGDQYSKQTFFSVRDSKSYDREISWLHNKLVLCCSYGWIVCLDIADGNLCYLYNPVSTENIELPPIPESLDIRRVFLSKPPSHPDCLIFIIGRMGHLGVCKVHDNKFVESRVTFGDNSVKDLISFRGKIYGVTYAYEFVALDIVDNLVVQRKPLLKDDGSPFQIHWHVPKISDSFMIDSSNDEEVLFVLKTHSTSFNSQVTRFKVFRLDFNDLIYQELESIGERTIFLASFHGIMCSKPGPGIKVNSIYYVRCRDNRLYVHDLEDQSRLLLLPRPDTRHDALLSWVMI